MYDTHVLNYKNFWYEPKLWGNRPLKWAQTAWRVGTSSLARYGSRLDKPSPSCQDTHVPQRCHFTRLLPRIHVPKREKPPQEISPPPADSESRRCHRRARSQALAASALARGVARKARCSACGQASTAPPHPKGPGGWGVALGVARCGRKTRPCFCLQTDRVGVTVLWAASRLGEDLTGSPIEPGLASQLG